MAASEPSSEVFSWLKTLPLAPEFHPSPAEFQDPISYIFKIEKLASKYGICKIVPPVSPAPKKTAILNLNRSLAARNLKSSPTFTTRQQQIGFCPRKGRPVRRPVWQSGECYTFQQFETKAKSFEKNYLKKFGKKGGLSGLDIETLFWKASVDKPFSVEYANDMPGSAFAPVGVAKGGREVGDVGTVGETAWNMRGVSRAKGSLLRFMKEEIPGVTSPMVYVAMMFSWFAWHAEDHDLHSLNYMHMGAGKTWYGVPRDAADAFEEVVRVHGYGGEINPLVTFAILGEKTTVMSPEVFIGAGIPCCRLVQNAGEFVVTFPRAYHSGFSHGFNCGEAANIATPEWLRVAKDAAIRRASINYPPMVSHFQLLYDLTLELCSRIPMRIDAEPRSSRLKDKKKGEGETMVKEQFVQNVIQNNGHLHILGKGSSIVVLPQSSSDISVYSKLRVGSQLRATPGLSFSLYSPKEAMKSSTSLVSDDDMIDRKQGIKEAKGFYSVKQTFASLCGRNKLQSEREGTVQSHGLSDRRLFSCVTCGIITFDCFAIIQPKEPAATYLMSADCSFFNDGITDPGITSNGFNVDGKNVASFYNSVSDVGETARRAPDGLYDVPVQSADYQIHRENQSNGEVSNSGSQRHASALGLLALNYGNSSDSEEDQVESRNDCEDEVPLQLIDCYTDDGCTRTNSKEKSHQTFDCSVEFESEKLKFSKAIVPSEDPDRSLVPRSDDDSSKMHVFCLEHAVEVEQKLRPIGGVHVLLLCHPDYPKLEAEAKLVAEELGNDSLWHDITFRDTTEEDEERIRSALHSEEVTPGNGDWAVKLGINLYYSANLSRSPLYSKQMPYNSVIYNAFGRSSPASSLAKPIVYGRRSGKQKKVVVGRWCGKVWMSNQVHPFLAQKHLEEQDQDQDQDRSFHAFVLPDEKLERDSENNHKTEITMVTRKSRRKRKMTSDNISTKKVKCIDDSLEDNSHQQDSGILRSKRTKWIDNVDLFSDSLKDNSHRQHKTVIEKEDGVSHDLVADNSHPQCRWNLRGKQAKFIEKKFSAADDTLEDDFHQKCSWTIRGKQSKQTEREDGVSDDDSLDDNLHWRHKSLRGKQAKCFEREDEAMQTSLDDNSYRQQGICIEQEDAVSNNLRGKKPKPTEKEDMPRNNSHQQRRMMLRGKAMKRETPVLAKQPTLQQMRKQASQLRNSVTVKEEQDGGPSTRLRKRAPKPQKELEAKVKGKNLPKSKKRAKNVSTNKVEVKEEDGGYQCDIEGCSMSFGLKQELVLHKRNVCPVKGCGKKFLSHKYLVQHRKVHMDDRPLKCPWRGCKMTFKWAWARTEHIRVHTGVRPYACAEPGCGQTFRFVSDFSRHKRKTGHATKKSRSDI